MCFVFSTTASGSAREPASLMYVLSVVMIGLTAPGFAGQPPSCAARAAFGDDNRRRQHSARLFQEIAPVHCRPSS